MGYKIVISPKAVEGYKAIPIGERSAFRKFIEHRLAFAPEATDDLTIMGLPNFQGVKCQFTIGEAHVYYDIGVSSVEVLLIIPFAINEMARMVITQKGGTFTSIPKGGIRKVSISELLNRIEDSRSLMKSGKGLLFNEVPL